MKPWAIIDSLTHTVQNTCSWDGICEWHPPQGCFVVDLSNQLVQPSIGWRWLAATKTFAPPLELVTDGKVLLLADGSVWKPEPTVTPKPTVKAEPLPPEKVIELPHREINWTLTDRGQQSPLFFKPGAEVAEIYEDRMKVMYAEGMYADSPKEMQHGS